MTYEQLEEAAQSDVKTPGQNCKHCGKPGFQHDRERVERDGDRYGYRLECPT